MSFMSGERRSRRGSSRSGLLARPSDSCMIVHMTHVVAEQLQGSCSTVAGFCTACVNQGLEPMRNGLLLGNSPSGRAWEVAEGSALRTSRIATWAYCSTRGYSSYLRGYK